MGNAELPQYKCHKVVRAGKIEDIAVYGDGSADFLLEGGAYAKADRAFVEKHTPTPGGYYVVYEDGYASFSPAKAFEDGYMKVEPMGSGEANAPAIDSASDQRIANNVMRHEYRVLSDNEKVDMRAIKDAGLDFLRHVETLETRRGPSRELSIAKTKIEEAVMWAVKHITA